MRHQRRNRCRAGATLGARDRDSRNWPRVLAVFGRLLLGSMLAACAASPQPAAVSRYELIVLGIAQDGGVPHVGCERACCAEARRAGRAAYPTALALHDVRPSARS